MQATDGEDERRGFYFPPSDPGGKSWLRGRGGERGMKLEPKRSEDRSPRRPNLKAETGTGVRFGGQAGDANGEAE